MKCEDVPVLRIWIEAVGELRFDAGAFVRKRQRFTELRVNIEQTFAVFAGLFLDARQREAFRLRFDCADGFAIDEKKIIDFISVFQERFAKSNATSRGQINRAAVVGRPTAFSQKFVDLLARDVFGGLRESAENNRNLGA